MTFEDSHAADPHTPHATFVHSRGVRLRVDVQGPRNAPLVLLIHGFGGGAFDWHPLMRELAGEDLRLAAVDLRGYGRSDKTPRGYDLTTAASDMAGVIRGLGHTTATVVGHGFGGMVAWTLVAHNPERIRSFVTLSAINPLLRFRRILIQPFSQPHFAHRLLSAQLPRLPERKLLADNAAAAEKIFRAGVAPGFRDTDAYFRSAALRREAMQVDKVAHLSCEYLRWPFRSRFRPEAMRFERTFPATTPVPLLAVDGSMDPIYDESLAQKSAQKAATVEHKVLFGVGHYPHVEDPPCVAELLREHLHA
ncbi:hydrolase [Corynebacterium jeikeium]|uniref:Putative hydrolase n=1 Tax=Corynebacterium jeikeium (strain K411) TaxID=306537 RepID=Q4JSQ8_CORJK|nr:alpha/beta hydrolase [Corynebacterium jeikeium]CAI38149.1 putative hydrolase [Corynebacterium jeikeium K411]SUY84500.1 hydrolase [Corynebacterium jeikeium]